MFPSRPHAITHLDEVGRDDGLEDGFVHGIQLPQLLDTRLDHGLHFLQHTDIRERDAALSSQAFDLFGDFFAAGFVGGDVVDADVVAVAGEAEGDGFADAAGGAGHYCCFAERTEGLEGGRERR